MTNWQEALLGAGIVEANNAGFAMTHGKLGNFECAIVLTHCSDQLTGQHETAFVFDLFDGVVDTGLHCLNNFVERQAALKVLLWRITKLAANHAIGSKVEHKLASNALELIGGLHHGCGVHKSFEVTHKRTAVCRLGEPTCKRCGVVSWQHVANLGS